MIAAVVMMGAIEGNQPCRIARSQTKKEEETLMKAPPTMSTYVGYFALVLSFLCLVGATEASAQDANAKSGEDTDVVTLERVENSHLCMPMNKAFDEKQIPVSIDGQTYYGCCQMCVSRLKEEPATRTAIDPVSGEEVNKAEAVAGATSDGTVYYFKSEENMKKFEPEIDGESSSDDS